ncbi:MAG TPA: PQQ-binding-like beta-propeller repeat protein [Candidatus Polarisedimenticolaceae bacterium]|nr:PQQ-binding-like beta-propeller repeat protein [Candidatus Polarisedimenticolaceae bacterium]
MTLRSALQSALAVAAFAAVPASAGERPAPAWAQWRGPDRAAHALDFDAPDAWPEKLTRVWRVEVGAGVASPVVAAERVCLLTRDGDDETASCRRLEDGSLIWSRSYSSPFYANGGAINPRWYPVSRGRGPFATPVLHDGRLLTLGVDRVLSSFDAATGELVWQRRFIPVDVPAKPVFVCRPCGCVDDGKKFDSPGICPACGMGLSAEGIETAATTSGGNYYGAASSPLVAGDLGVVHVGNPTRGLLVGFDPTSGEERWRWEGPVVGYSSPVMATIHDERQVVTMTRTAVVGVSAATGRPLWTFAIDNNAHAATPVVLGDLVICSEYRGRTFAVRVAKIETGWEATLAWANPEMTQWFGTPVLDADRLYGFFYSRRGQLAALDARTGETLWTDEGRQGESAAVVAAGNELLALTNDGRLLVFGKAADSHRPIRSYELTDSPAWTYPALVGRDLLIKDEAALTRWSVD